MPKLLLRLMLCPLFTLTLYSQTPAQSASYTVESIAPSPLAARNWSSLSFSDDAFDAHNVPLRELIAKAYGMPPELVFGLDPAVADARYNIHAYYAPADGNRGHVPANLLLRNFLAEHFGVQAHRESRVMPAYVVTVASGGIHFAAAQVTGERAGIQSNDHNFNAHNVDMTFIAKDLAGPMHAIVVDQTGLTGKYDLHLSWTPSSDRAAEIAAIQQAAENQLGLKLELGEAPVESLVVDHVQLASR